MTAFAPFTRRRVGALALACAAVAAAGPALAQEVVKIGYSGPLSGALRSTARTCSTACRWPCPRSMPPRPRSAARR